MGKPAGCRPAERPGRQRAESRDRECETSLPQCGNVFRFLPNDSHRLEL